MAKICNNVDKTNLQNKVDEINGLNKDNYINFESIEETLNKAETVLNDMFATQTEVDEVLKELTDAQNKLVLKKADYTKVDEAISKADALNKDEYVDFSEVEQAIKAVVRDLDITKQAEVDKMAEAIETAIKNLKRKPDNKPDDKPDNKPDVKPDDKPDGKPQQKPSNKPNTKPDTTNKPVKTGDEAPILPFAVTIAGAGAVIALLLKKRK